MQKDLSDNPYNWFYHFCSHNVKGIDRAELINALQCTFSNVQSHEIIKFVDEHITFSLDRIQYSDFIRLPGPHDKIIRQFFNINLPKPYSYDVVLPQISTSQFQCGQCRSLFAVDNAGATQPYVATCPSCRVVNKIDPNINYHNGISAGGTGISVDAVALGTAAAAGVVGGAVLMHAAQDTRTNGMFHHITHPHHPPPHHPLTDIFHPIGFVESLLRPHVHHPPHHRPHSPHRHHSPNRHHSPHHRPPMHLGFGL